jgi:hypothetical protein
LMNHVDIGVGTLGLHRIGLKRGSTLKTKEYCARGIPFIYGYEEKQLTENDDYDMRIPSDDSPVDFVKCIEFAERSMRNKEVSQRMRIDARSKFDWSVQMKPILQYLESVRKSG